MSMIDALRLGRTTSPGAFGSVFRAHFTIPSAETIGQEEEGEADRDLDRNGHAVHGRLELGRE